MKPGMLVLVATALACLPVQAQSPREQLQQLTAELQRSPNDNALRERIVKLAAQIKPSPVIPDEANRREGRGKFAFRSAKSNGDFLAAATEFEAAALAAPWVAGYYSDLCTIYEKVERYADAKRNCELYLAGLTDSAQVADAKQRIAGLEFGMEKASSPEARAAKQKVSDDDLMRSLEGAVFAHSYSNIERKIRISNGRGEVQDRRLASGGPLCGSGAQRSGPIGEQMACPHDAIRFEGRRGQRSHNFGVNTFEIAEDGKTMVVREAFNAEIRTIVFKRQ